MGPVVIIRVPTTRETLKPHTLDGEMLKAVVDVRDGVMAIGGELHADEEQVLLDQGSSQEHLWGINLYPGDASDGWLEFDGMINLRPSQGNRSRGVEDPVVQERIRALLRALVLP